MGYHQPDLIRLKAVLFQNISGRLLHDPDGQLEHFLALHPDKVVAAGEGLDRGGGAAAAGGDVEEVRVLAQRAQAGPEEPDAGLLAGADDDGPGPVPEKEACAAVLPV